MGRVLPEDLVAFDRPLEDVTHGWSCGAGEVVSRRERKRGRFDGGICGVPGPGPVGGAGGLADRGSLGGPVPDALGPGGDRRRRRPLLSGVVRCFGDLKARCPGQPNRRPQPSPTSVLEPTLVDIIRTLGSGGTKTGAQRPRTGASMGARRAVWPSPVLRGAFGCSRTSRGAWRRSEANFGARIRSIRCNNGGMEGRKA